MDQCSMVTLNLTFGDKCIKTDAVDQLLLSEGVCRQFNPVSSSSRPWGVGGKICANHLKVQQRFRLLESE